MSKVVLIYDEKTGTYISLKKKLIRDAVESVKARLKDPKKEAITLNDIYGLLIEVINLLEVALSGEE
jgi:hypothetical protein